MDDPRDEIEDLANQLETMSVPTLHLEGELDIRLPSKVS